MNCLSVTAITTATEQQSGMDCTVDAIWSPYRFYPKPRTIEDNHLVEELLYASRPIPDLNLETQSDSYDPT